MSKSECQPCPECGGEVTFGYGLAGGGGGGTGEDQGPAGYRMCLDCDWLDPRPQTTVCFPHGLRTEDQ